MSILADCQYSINDFNRIEETCQINELESYIIKNINNIAKKVGAPSYIKTPVFKKMRQNKKRELKQNKNTNNWDVTFKKTELKKNEEGIEVEFDKVRAYLNKLTSKNYDEILEKIIIMLKIIEKEDSSYLEKLGESIFDIGSKNKFWSTIYAKLYKDIITDFPFMQEICFNNFNKFKTIFRSINYIDSSEDYNLFCEYNKENEKRRALSKFFVLCANYNLIDRQEILKIVKEMQNIINTLLVQQNFNNHIEELTENLKIIITNVDDNFKNLEDYNVIYNEVDRISNLNIKDYPSLSNKILFNLMDITDTM